MSTKVTAGASSAAATSGNIALKAEPMDPPAQKPFVMHLMTLAQAGNIVNRLGKFAIYGDKIFARQPVGTGGNNLGADYLDEAAIRDAGLTEEPLYYLLKPVNSLAPEFDAYAQNELLDAGPQGFVKLWAERNPGHSTAEAWGALANIPSVFAAIKNAVNQLT